MKFDEKLKISEKSQRRIDRVMIILGLGLLVASGCSYFVIDAFGQQDLQLECPKNAYHGLDNQGKKACRDILTNQILEPESVIIIDSNSEKTKSDSWIFFVIIFYHTNISKDFIVFLIFFESSSLIRAASCITLTVGMRTCSCQTSALYYQI